MPGLFSAVMKFAHDYLTRHYTRLLPMLGGLTFLRLPHFLLMNQSLAEQRIKLLILIHKQADEINFGDGVSTEWILKAETRLQIKLPPSYKWRLATFGMDTVYSDEIYGIYFDKVIGGDVVYMNELSRKSDYYPATHLQIFKNDQGETYYLALEQVDEQGESCVYVRRGTETALYAQNLLEFLIHQLING